MTTALDQCVEAARKAGCPRDQVERYLRAGIALLPKQWEAAAAARQCDRPDGPTEVSYGGARGGGKSHFGLAQVFIDDCGRVPNLKFLYLRKVGKAAREQVQDLRREVLHSVPHDYLKQEGVLVRHDNESRVVLGHFQSEKDIDQYLGLQYDGVLIEEATQLSLAKKRAIGTCIRTSKPTRVWRPRKYLTTNPGGVGHGWYKAAFIDPWRKGTQSSTRHIQATVHDNPCVNSEYRSELERLTGWQLRAWLHGDWDIAAGQYFTPFRREVHGIRPFEFIPLAWKTWLSLDYGFAHWTACYLFAETPDGVLYSVGEHAARQTLPVDHDRAIRAMLERYRVDPRRITQFVAGHDVFARDHNGNCVADAYSELGWDLERANVDRINGAAAILKRLGRVDPLDGPRIEPTVWISEDCPRLLDSLPLLEHDPNRGEDVKKVDCDEDGQGGDDFYDAFRYGVMGSGNNAAVRVIENPFADYRG